TLREAIAALPDKDPFIRSAAIERLSEPGLREKISSETAAASADVRLGALLAMRRARLTNEAPRVLEILLADPDARIRQMALVWAGEDSIVSLTNRLGAALKAGAMTPALLRT